MLKLFFAVVVGLMVFTTQAGADTIKLKNGDRLTGAIVKSDEKALVLRTDYAGAITVKWEAIQEIESRQPLHVVSRNGQTLVGTLASIDDKIAVTAKDGGKVELSKSEITILRNAQQQAVEDRLAKPRLRDLWTGSADFGLSLSSGNAAITAINAGGDLARNTRHDRTAFFYRQISTTDRSVSPVRKLVNAKRAGAEYIYHLTSRLSALGIAYFDFDERLRLDLRATTAGGLGYRFIKNERTTFRVFGGLAYIKETFDVTPRATAAVPRPVPATLSRNGLDGLLGEEWRFRMNPRTQFFEKVEYYPSFRGVGYRLNTDSGLTVGLTQYLGLNLTLSTRYLDQPPLPGIKKSDTLLTTGIRFNFGR